MLEYVKATEKWIRQKVKLKGRRLEDVRTLILPGTQSSKIISIGSSLKKFTRLKNLDLQRNSIQSLQGFQHLELLEKLNLYYNAIASIAELALLKGCTHLIELDLRLNPVTRLEPDYRLYLIYLLPSLRVLDDRSIRDDERKAALMHFAAEQAYEFDQAFSDKHRHSEVDGSSVDSSTRANFNNVTIQHGKQGGEISTERYPPDGALSNDMPSDRSKRSDSSSDHKITSEVASNDGNKCDVEVFTRGRKVLPFKTAKNLIEHIHNLRRPPDVLGFEVDDFIDEAFADSRPTANSFEKPTMEKYSDNEIYSLEKQFYRKTQNSSNKNSNLRMNRNSHKKLHKERSKTVPTVEKRIFHSLADHNDEATDFVVPRDRLSHSAKAVPLNARFHSSNPRSDFFGYGHFTVNPNYSEKDHRSKKDPEKSRLRKTTVQPNNSVPKIEITKASDDGRIDEPLLFRNSKNAPQNDDDDSYGFSITSNQHRDHRIRQITEKIEQLNTEKLTRGKSLPVNSTAKRSRDENKSLSSSSYQKEKNEQQDEVNIRGEKNTSLLEDNVDKNIDTSVVTVFQAKHQLLTKLCDLVDKYWNGRKSLHDSTRFQDKAHEFLDDFISHYRMLEAPMLESSFFNYFENSNNNNHAHTTNAAKDYYQFSGKDVENDNGDLHKSNDPNHVKKDKNGHLLNNGNIDKRKHHTNIIDDTDKSIIDKNYNTDIDRYYQVSNKDYNEEEKVDDKTMTTKASVKNKENVISPEKATEADDYVDDELRETSSRLDRLEKELLESNYNIANIKTRLDKTNREKDRLSDTIDQLSFSSPHSTKLQNYPTNVYSTTSSQKIPDSVLVTELKSLRSRLKQYAHLSEMTSMLQESHKSLVDTNEHLLQEINELKRRFKKDEI